jgi:hypothetical protein
MSTIAVFLALGGTSWAVARNSVGTRELKDDAVTSAKVRDGAIARRDLAADVAQAGPRGPRGAQGPAGPVGPSEVVQVRRVAGVGIPSQGGRSVLLASLTLDPGAWSIEAQTTVRYDPSSPGSEWFTCRLETAAGTDVGSGMMRVGTDAYAAVAGVVSARGATTLPTSTLITFICSHPSPIALPDAEATATVVMATRVGAVHDR